MNAEILCVGTELLLGDIINTNAAFLSKELALLGINCYYQTVVGDNPERLKTSLAIALGRSDLVITTGGLGPTYDDLTKETVAVYFGLEMEMHEESLQWMTDFFARLGREMTPNNAKQAMMPKGSVVLKNDRGTAPGVVVEGKGKTVIMMPGPPREMTAMFELQAKPYLQSRSNTVLVSHNIHLYNIGESAVEDRLKDYMQAHLNPTVAPYAKEGEVLLRVTASAKTPEDADRLIRPVLAEIQAIFPQNIYGVDVGTLQNALVLALREKGLSIATAESCTGGYVSKRITEIPGSSEVFAYGISAYSEQAKQKLLGVSAETLERHGAVSPETALEMARGVRRLSGASIGLAVTGLAGPGGGTEQKPVGLVYLGLSTEKEEKTLELHLRRGYGGERELIRMHASSQALYYALCAARA